MEDDIDIEEHDVLDNPRIKSIFPDLSCVKIEVLDVEDIVEEQDAILDPILEPTQEPQEVLYQYEYNFGTTADDIPEHVQKETEEDYLEEHIPEHVQEETEENYLEEEGDREGDLEEEGDGEGDLEEEGDREEGDLEEEGDGEDSHHFNNEIILGSKPSPDMDLLYEEALHSQPIVYLENWEDRLKSSSCFCNTCEILFPTGNALDAHKMVSHSFLIAMDTSQKNTARKSTVTSKFCNHCSKTFPDDTSLIKHLYELLPLNNFKKEEKKEPEKRKYATAVPWKIKTTSHVITKIHPKKIKVEPRESLEEEEIKPKLKSMLSKDGKFFAASNLVPKSTLFQCNVCQVGFLSCFSACQHAKSCKKVSSFEKCGICKRKIRIRDAKTHELQHNYNEKLKIYTTHRSIYDRVLCKCPKCLACFDELAFWAHYAKCKKTDKKTIYCADCDEHIALSRYKCHKIKHSTKKLTKKDFIVVEFYDQSLREMVSAEKRTEIMRQQRRERQREYKARYLYKKRMCLKNSKLQVGDIKVYYCEFCGCCQCRLNYKGHSDGFCKRTMVKKYCEKCGLCFTSKSIESHLNLHQKRSFTVKDISMVSLITGKSMDPPISDFYECSTCFKNFLYRRSLHFHNCKTEKYITCKICTKKFNIQAFKIHKIFHSADKLMPELMKKYKLIDNMWNVMYMCVSCELVTMTYDSAVTHSQGHLNYIISDLHKQCVICDLRIAEKEFSLHEKLHSNNKSIERESFKILSYNHEDLFKREWMNLFNGLPPGHREQILSKSIYRFTRSVKMEIAVSASMDETKYFCVNCNTFIDGININRHIKSKCARNNKLVCKICHDVFKSIKQFLTHEGSHENVPKYQTIVTFNNECDKEFNNHLSLIESEKNKSNNDVNLSVTRDALSTDNVKGYKLYKCVKCETCVTLKSSVRRHRCVPITRRRFCEICQQFFSSEKTSVHLEAHRKKPFINKDSFFIVYFNTGGKTPTTASKTEIIPKNTPKISLNKLIAKIFACSCGLHFTSMKTIEKHLEHCSPKLEVSKETCSKCNLVFPTELLVTHLVNHHHKRTKIEIEKIAKVNVFKCPQCFVLFPDMASFNSHNAQCDSKNSIHCNVCGLNFGKHCFSKHMCSSGDVTYMNKINVVKNEKNINEAVVYRCVACDITYLRRNSYRYHTNAVNHSLKKPPTPCEECGLKFTHCSYVKHMSLHSTPNAEYVIKVLEPDNGRFEILTGVNRCKDDVYSTRRKRKVDTMEGTPLIKKLRSSQSEIDTTLSDRRFSRRVIDKASTSTDSKIDFDDTPSEIIVPDEILNHDNLTDSTSNVSDIDISVASRKIRKDTSHKSRLSSKMKSRMMIKGYGRKLYKCVNCPLHYMKDGSLLYHLTKNPGHHDSSDIHKCEICDIEFSKDTLPRHKYVHHDKMRLKKEDFIIFTGSLDSSNKFKIENDSEILDASSQSVDDNMSENDSVNDTKILLDVSDNCDSEIPSDVNISDTCDTNSEINDIVSSNDTKELSDVNINDTEILSDVNISDNCDAEIVSDVNISDNCDAEIVSDVNISDNCDAEIVSDVNISDNRDANNSENVSENDKICYFKCSDCNVCFVDQTMCFEHTSKHDILDPKTYIQCKICNFQFFIDSLKEHMVLHHNSDFMIEKLTIHEYKPLGIGLDPKIDIYQAFDKLQSRLVSTTTDVGII